MPDNDELLLCPITQVRVGEVAGRISLATFLTIGTRQWAQASANGLCT